MIRTAFVAISMAVGLLAASGAQAALVLQSQAGEGNDCSGVFGSGFENCVVGGSPVIAKWGTGGSWETNSLYPSITGAEWTIGGGNWSYNPGANDPAIKYWVSKNGNGFTLFWFIDDTSACGTVLACAVAATSGTYIVEGISHITFYNSGRTTVPEPTTLALMGLGLAGLGFASRRRRKA